MISNKNILSLKSVYYKIENVKVFSTNIKIITSVGIMLKLKRQYKNTK